MKKKNKLTAALAALVLFSGVSAASTTYAWWNTLKANSNITIKVGERITLTVTPSDLSEGQLVPNDIDLKADQVAAVTTSYALNISGDVDLSLLQLKVTDEGRTFDGDAESDLVDYFVVKVEDTVVDADNYYIKDAAASMTVAVEFSIVVPTEDRTTETAEALSAGTFVITLGFEVLNKPLSETP